MTGPRPTPLLATEVESIHISSLHFQFPLIDLDLDLTGLKSKMTVVIPQSPERCSSGRCDREQKETDGEEPTRQSERAHCG